MYTQNSYLLRFFCVCLAAEFILKKIAMDSKIDFELLAPSVKYNSWKKNL